ncbi:hypothetical protein PHG01_00048 [Streptococcus mutans PKUSS-HG01]|nr:hypothetical protein SMU29_05959 [Streptococcus mutans 2ST1]EMB73102.1 hypothetical protein SMU36_03189 [Streptococcus mutans 4VF1]EMC09781.1 hypothetical protein SMU72_01245 [Streptococcus mutans NLML9]EMC21596.1 hypothetical protein SMU80_02340 [Streptococcus mutans SF1]EMC32846.1 hypothetical protein SMU89_05176 [Streptococcus mutans NLML1]EMC36102.1 hypothetical protein SMU93_06463 [Streptococcus mutans 21]EMC59008.1 hypothetical protein SMU107_02144 [Streptococcus mutans R221]ESS1937
MSQKSVMVNRNETAMLILLSRLSQIGLGINMIGRSWD